MTELEWNERPVTQIVVVASISRFFDLFLGPHIKMLRDLGLELTLMAAERPDQTDSGRFVLVPFSRRFHSGFSHLRSLRVVRGEIKTLLRSGGAIVIHTHTPIAAAIVRAAIPQKHRDRVCVVYVAHGLHFLPTQKNQYWALERLLARRTDLIITMNSDDFESATRLGVGGSPKVGKVPGIGCQRAKLGRRRQPRGHELAVIGVLESRKRPDDAIKALTLLPTDHHLTFYGRGPMRNKLMLLAESLGIGDRVRFAGFTADLSDAYGSSDCLVFLSRQEGLPMTVVEATAAGLPVVAHDIRGVRDVLEGLDSWFIPADLGPAAVARSITKALESDPDIDSLHARADAFSVDTAVAAHRDLIVGLLSPEPRRQSQNQ